VAAKTTATPTAKATATPTRKASATPIAKPTATPTTSPKKSVAPTKKPKNPSAQPTSAPCGDICNHGSDLMPGTVNLYNIWYGADYRTGASQGTINLVTGFVNALGGSPYFNTTAAYSNTAGVYLANSLSLAPSSTIISSEPEQITIDQSFVVNLIFSNLVTNALPVDYNGIYNFFFKGVNFDGFETQWCGFHSTFGLSYDLGATYKTIKYAVIGDVGGTSAAYACGHNTQYPTANGDVGGDSMISVLAHELAETVTDPMDFYLGQNGYFSDTSGEENGDMCSWNFGTYLPGSSNANLALGDKNYLVQQLYVPKVKSHSGQGGCFMSY